MYMYVSIYMCIYMRFTLTIHGVLHLYVKLLKSLDDVSCGVNILVVRLIEDGGEDTYMNALLRAVAPTPAGPAMTRQVFFVSLGFAHVRFCIFVRSV